jgi:Protein tyrosine and serine/threonine kinase
LKSLGLDCENVLLRKDGSLALTGFSLSGLGGSQLNITRVKEQLTYHGIAQVDLERGDIYSLGILLWEILHGKRAFEDNYDPGLLEEIMEGRRPGMNGNGTELPAEGVPPDYIRLYEACWHTDPKVWPTISNIVARLETMRRLAEEDQAFNWEQLDSIWIGWEQKQLTGI